MHCTGGNVHNLPKVIITKYYKQKAYSEAWLLKFVCNPAQQFVWKNCPVDTDKGTIAQRKIV